MFRRACTGALLIVVTSALIAVAASCKSDKAAAEGETVARINDVPIWRDRFLSELRQRAGRAVLEQMIGEVLIRQRANELGLAATPQELDRAYERAVAMAGSEGDLQRQLERSGMTQAQFRETLVPQVLLDKILAQTVEVTAKEIEEYYRSNADEFRLPERVRARLMMLTTRDEAETMRKMLDQKGADFAGLAKAVSIDPGTKDEGGDTGYFAREDYAEEIASRAFAMEVGDVSDAFEAPDGFCILKLTDRRPPEMRPLAEVRDMIKSRLAYAKQQQLRQTWVAEQRKKADVSILDPQLR